MKGIEAGTLIEVEKGKEYLFEYLDEYIGLVVSRTMMIQEKSFKFKRSFY